jgi:Protein of unknown function (DUF3866)
VHSGDDNAVVIRLREGVVVAVTGERPGAVELTVESDGERRAAVAYPALVGPVAPGDPVLLNTTAVALGLGSGGAHFVVAVMGRGRSDLDPGPGHVMKLRYTPLQVATLAVEEDESPHHAAMSAVEGLDGTPVVWLPLHSMLGPAAAGARAQGAERVVYVMTDGAALAGPLSRLAASLREAGLLDAVVSAGQSFGGDLESVNTFTGLLAAKAVRGADVILVGDGPGNTGTDTTWGSSAIESAMAMQAARILGGQVVAALRISFADARERHRGVSHHSLTALDRVAPDRVVVAVPELADPGQRDAVHAALRRLVERHTLAAVDGVPAIELLERHGIEAESMGRSFKDDPAFFLAAGAAGVLAGRMAAATGGPSGASLGE